MSEHNPHDRQPPKLIEVPDWVKNAPPSNDKGPTYADLVQASVDAVGDDMDGTGDVKFLDGAEALDAAPKQAEFGYTGRLVGAELQATDSPVERFKVARVFIEEVLAAAERGEVTSSSQGVLGRADVESRLKTMATELNRGEKGAYTNLPSNGELRAVFAGFMHDERSATAILDAILHPDLLERAGEPLREEVAEDMGETAVEATETNPYEDFLNGNEHLDPNDTQHARVEEAPEVREARRLAQERRTSDINDAANKAAGRPEMN
ncbi:hypothetical protein LRY29_01840 [Candidatus Saccharibacteria bacterium]|nr:hypothetical protein [Candidatus Saccharibacteria bacterium]